VTPVRERLGWRSTPSVAVASRWLALAAMGYLLGSYRSATAPEPNSSRLTSVKSTCFDSPREQRRPMARYPER
jgi:hypothetical protein